jgi:hypothetical protein
MSYRAQISEEFEEGFRLLPHPVWNFTKEHIHRLCDDPVRLGRQAEHPWPRYVQVYRPEAVEIDGIRYTITILFRFKQDEIHIEFVGVGCETEPVI